MAAKKNQLVPITKSMPALAGDVQELALAFKENLGGEKVSVFDLERIKIPSGGGPAFTIVDPDSTEDSAKQVSGTIVWIEPRKAYWQDSNVDGSPPTCRSLDMQTGAWVGQEGEVQMRDCYVCPFNQFGSQIKDDGEQGRGKACKDMRLIFFMRDKVESFLPSLLILPPTSIKPMQKFLVSLASKGIAISAAFVNLTLSKETNTDGTPYSAIRPALHRKLAKEETDALRSYINGIKAAFATMDTAPVESSVNERSESPA